MKECLGKLFSFAIILVLLFGCARGKILKDSESMEAKDWLHAGDLAYKLKDYETASYCYELVIRKYPNTSYSRRAKINMGYIHYQRSIIGQPIQKVVEFVDPVVDDPPMLPLQK